jgi:pimeloyl-ACP methyl ester carboxylesterase
VDRGYRVLALDRPGIGRSDYAGGRRLLDWPEDVREAAGRLGVDSFGVIGVSGGGPYALACCLAMPHRLRFAVLMGSWGPVAEEPALWREMAPLDRFFGRLSRVAPWAFYVPFSLLGFAAKALSPRGFIRFLASSMREADGALPRSTLHAYPGEGHLFVMRLFDEVLAKTEESAAS